MVNQAYHAVRPATYGAVYHHTLRPATYGTVYHRVVRPAIYGTVYHRVVRPATYGTATAAHTTIIPSGVGGGLCNIPPCYYIL